MPGTIIIANAVVQTWIFIGLLMMALLLSARRSNYGDLLSIAATQELKGIAILAVVFGHIGYFLVDDNRFLFPLSVGAGVGVNIFLFLSGYGLTVGQLNKSLSAPKFYRKRALKIFIPFWIALAFFLVLDASVLHRYYSWSYIARSIAGFFPRADMADDVNSVFWYLTWILFFYLLFPLVFIRHRVWLSALILFALGEALVRWNPAVIELVTRLYQVHTVAFPLGMIAASLLFESREKNNAIATALRHWRATLSRVQYFMVIALLIGAIVYSAYYDSGIGQSILKEQAMSMVTTLALVMLFALKRFELRVLALIGFFSYEIYLLHWPLLSRYDFIYRHMPAAAATVIYLAAFMAMGWLMQRGSDYIANRFGRQRAKPIAST